MRRTRPVEWTFLAQESVRTPSHCGIFAVCEEGATTAPAFEDVLDEVDSRLTDAPVLRQRLVDPPLHVDHPFWIDDPDFDLEFHVRPMWVPSPGGWTELRDELCRVFSWPLDLHRPPWELYVIYGLDSLPGVAEGSFGLLIKIHHVAVDVGEGFQLANALFSIDPNASRRSCAPMDWRPESPPSWWTLLLHSLTGQAVQRLNPLTSVARTGRRLLSPGPGGPEAVVPGTRLSGRVSGPHRLIDAVSLDFADVHGIYELLPSTINDIALATVSGGLRRYLIAHGELPDQSLAAAVPIAMRSSEEMGAGGDRANATLVDLFTDVADDGERLAAISKISHQIRSMHAGANPHDLCALSEVVPGGPLGRCLRFAAEYRARRGSVAAANTTVIQTPGSRVPLYFLGRQVVSWHGLGSVHDGTGPVHVVTSYRNDFTISVVVDRGSMPDVAFYRSCLRDAFDGLCDYAAAVS